MSYENRLWEAGPNKAPNLDAPMFCPFIGGPCDKGRVKLQVPVTLPPTHPGAGKVVPGVAETWCMFWGYGTTNMCTLKGGVSGA